MARNLVLAHNGPKQQADDEHLRERVDVRGQAEIAHERIQQSVSNHVREEVGRRVQVPIAQAVALGHAILEDGWQVERIRHEEVLELHLIRAEQSRANG